jgi:hypothetical protein
MTTLKSRLDSLASTFATDVVRAIQSASLQELSGDIGGVRRGPGRPPSSGIAAAAKPNATIAKPKARKGGRLPRRSPEDIAKTLDKVVTLVKRHKEGLRAEQIRSELRMQANEMPRVLKEGLSKKALKSKGQKRATTYFAA